ncbi:MAG: sigma-54-dependent Fis family transcriptional regulator [Sphingobacteriales bacterium]|nr:sigma-54-dependent Fis family transcriptional regulator [Sphingobacteriales bacterium]
MNTVLIIDDEEKLRQLLKRIIHLEGFGVKEAGSLKEAKKLLEHESIDAVLCDVKLPDGNGVDFVREIKQKYPGPEIILLTAYGNISDGVQAMRNGAFDYITKGDDNDKIIPLLHRVMDKVLLARKLERLQQETAKGYSFDSIIGETAVIRNAIALARKVAPEDTTVLLLGETGTGKEVFAQALHYNSRRSMQAFIAVNCSAFTRDLLESELFGHKAGAFTGAVKDKKGLFEEANGGTMFLDEIGEMAPELQARLLRVLESGEFIKVGDTRVIKVNVRIIAATNRDLQKEAEAGHFRADLFYRLSVFQITLPSLRERIKDVPLLAGYFAGVFAAKTNKPVPVLGKQYLDALQHYHWPGNIRELKNVIERSVILESGGELSPATLPFSMLHPDHAGPGSVFELSGMEKQHILKVLQHTGGNKTEAARLLGIGLTTLYRKLEEYQIR